MELLSDIFYVAFFACALCLILVIAEGISHLAYRFIPWVRERVDEFLESLPDWTDK